MILREKLWNVWNTKILITIIITIIISSCWWSDQGKQWSSKSRDNISVFTFFPPGVICKLVSHIDVCHDCHIVGSLQVSHSTPVAKSASMSLLSTASDPVSEVPFTSKMMDETLANLQITIRLCDTWLFRLERGPIWLAVLGQPHSWELKSWKGDCTLD